MTYARTCRRLLACSLTLTIAAAGSAPAQTIPTPAEFAGHAIGADGKLVRWDRIAEYMNVIARGSDRVRVQNLGKTTLDNDFIAVLVSSPENLRRIDHFRDVGRQLAAGRSDDNLARQLAQEGRVFVVINHNIHSTEIGSSQTTLEMIHRLATDDSPEIREILDNVILVHIPSANPDGQIMVVDWYLRNAGTRFETSPMPWLYHHYVGHDNNRDLFMGNMIETRYLWQLVYQDYPVRVLLDQHQQGANAARIFVPPYPDPPNERVHPLIWQETRFFGAAMATALQSAGKKGVQSQGSSYRLYHQGGTASAWWHNITKLLTETASARMATPVTIGPEELEVPAADGVVSAMKVSQSYPDPWPGGVWRLRDVIDYQMIAALAVLTQSARYRQELLFGHHVMAHDAIARAAEGPYAYVVAPGQQRDPIAAADMVQRLIDQGVEVHRATSTFHADGVSYPAGTFVLLSAQSARPALTDLLEAQNYPELRRFEGGPPIRPYDVTGYTMSLQMGVSTERVMQPFDAQLERIARAEWRPATAQPARTAYVLNHEINRTFLAVNRLLRAGVPVYRSAKPLRVGDHQLSAGAFLVPANAAPVVPLAAELGIPLEPDPADLPRQQSQWGARVRAPRIALYRPWIPSMDEGWTRWILEQYGFDVTSLSNADVRAGALRDRFDVLIIPSQITTAAILNGYSAERVPAEYVGGIGAAGVANLRTFVTQGGELVTLGDAGEFAILHMNVPVANTVAGLPPDQFYGPGTILRLTIDTTHPLGYGLPPEVAAKFMNGSGYEVRAPAESPAGNANVVASYPADRDLLMSGMLVGADRLKGKGGIVDVSYGRGRIVMFGFAVQHRAQTHGTYKLLFNALYYSTTARVATR